MKHNHSEYLVLGATGSLGYAFTQELLSRDIKVTALMRDPQKGERLFKQNPNLEIIKGDVFDLNILHESAKGKKFILYGINYPYPLWEKYTASVTKNVIESASVSKAKIIFPGNVYPYGNIKEPITETTPLNPSTKKGRLRAEMQSLLKKAADEKRCSVLIFTLPDFWGPNTQNNAIKPIFINALKNKPMPWILNVNTPHQLVYTLDAARLIVDICAKQELSDYEKINISGALFPSIKDWFKQIAKAAGNPPKYKVLSKRLLGFISLFNAEVKELKENFYLYENTIAINDDKLKTFITDFKPTPVSAAIINTLNWYKENMI